MIRLILLSLMVLSFNLAYASPLPDAPHIYVEGSAEIDVEPDLLDFSIRLEHTDLDLAKAKAEVDAKSVKLIGLSRQLGIQDADISSTPLRLHPEYDYTEGKRVFLGTKVSREVNVTLRDLKKYQSFMAALTETKVSEIVSARLAISPENKQKTDQALLKALEDARSRATAIANLQGVKLGKAHSISEFDLRNEEQYKLIVNRNITGDASANFAGAMAADAVSMQRSGKEPFEPGTIKAKAQVFVVYLIK
jgi:uncharacterized protein YggE